MVGAPVSNPGNQPQPPATTGTNPTMNSDPKYAPPPQMYASPSSTLSTLLPYNGQPPAAPYSATAPPPPNMMTSPPKITSSTPINTSYLYPYNPTSPFPATSVPYPMSSATTPPPFPPSSTAPVPPFGYPPSAGNYPPPTTAAYPQAANPTCQAQPPYSSIGSFLMPLPTNGTNPIPPPTTGGYPTPPSTSGVYPPRY